MPDTKKKRNRQFSFHQYACIVHIWINVRGRYWTSTLNVSQQKKNESIRSSRDFGLHWILSSIPRQPQVHASGSCSSRYTCRSTVLGLSSAGTHTSAWTMKRRPLITGSRHSLMGVPKVNTVVPFYIEPRRKKNAVNKKGEVSRWTWGFLSPSRQRMLTSILPCWYAICGA